MAVSEKLFGAEAGMLRDGQFQLLLLANSNAALGTVVISPILESLTGPFAVSDVRIGLLMTAFTAPPVLAIPVIGVISDRYGRKPVLVSSLVLFGLAGVAIAFTTDFGLVLALRVLQGVGFAGILPVVITALSDLYAGPGKATAQGLRFSSSGATQAVFPLLSGVLLGFAWQYPFMLYLLALPSALLLALFLKETATPTVRSDSDQAGPVGRFGYASDVLSIVVRPRTALVLVAFSLPGFLHIAFLTYNSFLVVRALNGTTGIAGLLIAVFSGVYAVAASQAGRFTACTGGPMTLLAGTYLVMGAGLSITALAASIPIALVGVVVMGFGDGLCFALLRTVLTGLVPETYRGGLVGIGESLIRLSMSVAPIVVGLLLDVSQPKVGAGGAIRVSLVTVGILTAAVGALATLAAIYAPPVSVQSD